MISTQLRATEVVRNWLKTITSVRGVGYSNIHPMIHI